MEVFAVAVEVKGGSIRHAAVLAANEGEALLVAAQLVAALGRSPIACVVIDAVI